MKTNDGGPAFPNEQGHGMSLRDKFADSALKGTHFIQVCNKRNPDNQAAQPHAIN